ncbi:MAG: hypothetical protein II984_09425 [Clostridia bacterium]|nr:hypothetical protein [Clostridia bacterium]
MKKAIAILILLTMSLFIFSCGRINKFTELENDEVLYVGANRRYMNYEDENTVENLLTYTTKTKYELLRTYNDYNTGSVKYGEYYYYWRKTTETDTVSLGKETTKNTYKYSYLTYGENENIVVKTTVTTEKSYDFNGGFIEKDSEIEIDLNGYFSSREDLKEKCVDLYNQLDLNEKKQYFVDTEIPPITQSTKEELSTYFYIEKKK